MKNLHKSLVSGKCCVICQYYCYCVYNHVFLMGNRHNDLEGNLRSIQPETLRDGAHGASWLMFQKMELSLVAIPGAWKPLCDLLTDTMFCIIYIFSFSLSFLIIYSINPFFLLTAVVFIKLNPTQQNVHHFIN